MNDYLPPPNRTSLNRFQTGDPVWLHNPKRKQGVSPKLCRQWEGPYTVLKPINDLVYCIQLGPRSKPKVVHWNRLWRYGGDNPPRWLEWQTQAMQIPNQNSAQTIEHTSNSGNSEITNGPQWSNRACKHPDRYNSRNTQDSSLTRRETSGGGGVAETWSYQHMTLFLIYVYTEWTNTCKTKPPLIPPFVSLCAWLCIVLVLCACKLCVWQSPVHKKGQFSDQGSEYDLLLLPWESTSACNNPDLATFCYSRLGHTELIICLN